MLVPFYGDDISAIANSLRRQLAERKDAPGHVEWLNMLARSIGHRNFQQLRAQTTARERLSRPAGRAPEPVDFRKLERLARCFGADGRLERWPGKDSERAVAVWVLWSRIPPRKPFTEAEVNERLTSLHGFGDHALLRRELCDRGLMQRTRDGRVYRRVERPMAADAVAMLGLLKQRAARAESR